jgi:hypothetical protein
MLFSLHRHRPLFSMNHVLNDYVKNSNAQYIRNIIKDVEYKNKKNILFGENMSKNSLYVSNNLVMPSVFLLSLTTIIYYFFK